MYITSQVLALFALVFNVTGRIFKEQHKSVLFNFIANLINILSCIFLSAYMGMAGLVVATIRSLVFYLISIKKLDNKLWVLIIFLGLQLIASAITIYLSGFIWWDFVLVTVKSSFYAYGSWQKNVKVFWISSIISCILTIVYFALYQGYVNCAAEFLSIIIIVIVMIGFIKEKNKNSSNAACENENEKK